MTLKVLCLHVAITSRIQNIVVVVLKSDKNMVAEYFDTKHFLNTKQKQSK